MDEDYDYDRRMENDQDRLDLNTLDEVVRYTALTKRKLTGQLDPLVTAHAALDALEACAEIAEILRRRILRDVQARNTPPADRPAGRPTPLLVDDTCGGMVVPNESVLATDPNKEEDR